MREKPSLTAALVRVLEHDEQLTPTGQKQVAAGAAGTNEEWQEVKFLNVDADVTDIGWVLSNDVESTVDVPRLLVIVGETYGYMEIADRLISAIAGRMPPGRKMDVVRRQFRDSDDGIEHDGRWTHVLLIPGSAEEDYEWIKKTDFLPRLNSRQLPVILVVTPDTGLSWVRLLWSGKAVFHLVELDDGIRYFGGRSERSFSTEAFERAESQVARIILGLPGVKAVAPRAASSGSREFSSSDSHSEPPSRPDPDALATLIARRAEAQIEQINIPKVALEVPIFPETPEVGKGNASVDESVNYDYPRPMGLPPSAEESNTLGSSRSGIANLSRWIVLAASIGALSAAALFLFRRDLFDVLPPLIKVPGSIIPPAAAPGDLLRPDNADDADDVELAAFAPQVCGHGEIILIQALLHLPADRETARRMAVGADPAAVCKAAQTLSMAVRRGEKLDIDLEADGCSIDEPRQAAIWRGRPASIQFFATVPRQRKKPIPVRITVIRSGIPVGSIRFTIPVEAKASKKPIEIRGESAERFKRAFVSYASEDRVSVLKYAQVLNISGIEIFQDILSLEPGDRWERRLYEEIDRSDLFLLFWSKAASESKWVVAEAEHALRYYNKTASRRPVIRPILLEGPPIPKIPATLKAIHFNDKFRYLILGAEAEANARRPSAN